MLYKSDYNVAEAICYARQYALNYNPAYHNYNPEGGDCANFVSQVLLAGGLLMTDGWYYKYPDVTSSWINCKSMYSYFENAGFEIIENPTVNQLLLGNPILFDTGNGWGHAVIYVGDGKVCAHNNDRLNVDWQMYSRNCTILINCKQE